MRGIVDVSTRLRIFMVLLFCGSVLCCSSAQAQGLDNAQAIQKALTVTGLAGMEQVQIAAKQENLQEADKLPFLNMAGDCLWRVSLLDIKPIVRKPAKGKEWGRPWYREDGGAPVELEQVHSLDVLINKASGKIIKVSSPFVSGYPSKFSDEESLRAEGKQYVGLPDVPPKISLMEALQATFEGLGDTPAAKQIEASYVLYTTDIPSSSCHDSPCPVWAIILKGVPPLMWSITPVAPGEDGKPAGPPPYLNMRHLVNAVTGEWMGASSIP